jgi:hypothetical protein
MQYITGLQALNLKTSLDTPGDWHRSGLKWSTLTIAESTDSPFGDYGIEVIDSVPEHVGQFKVANHIRALLDIIHSGRFGLAQGMRDCFIDNAKYTEEIFGKVILLRGLTNWADIFDFMSQEYKMEWVSYVKRLES